MQRFAAKLPFDAFGLAFIAAFIFCSSAAVAGEASKSVFIEDLTSFELRDRIANGTVTVLIPIGGTEQNGPHIALGKHNVRVKYLAGLIAQRLGNAVVAPVLGYVPEGAIFPPVAHMRFTGTISIPDATFESILESTAKSLKQHGLHNIVFLGDHGGYQKVERRAECVNDFATPCVINLMCMVVLFQSVSFARAVG